MHPWESDQLPTPSSLGFSEVQAHMLLTELRPGSCFRSQDKASQGLGTRQLREQEQKQGTIQDAIHLPVPFFPLKESNPLSPSSGAEARSG